jgi:hypothetical protein
MAGTLRLTAACVNNKNLASHTRVVFVLADVRVGGTRLPQRVIRRNSDVDACEGAVLCPPTLAQAKPRLLQSVGRPATDPRRD